MLISDFIHGLDDPKAAIAYPQEVLYRSDSGHPVIGVDPHAQQVARRVGPIISPVQVIRRPGLGDKVFGLAATYKYIAEHPEMDITFSGLDTDTWLKQVPWVKTGINPACKSVVNLDNTPPNGGDRVKLMGEIMGVDVDDIRFPINIPKRKLGIKKPYYVFAPFAANQGPRSMPLATVISILKHSPIPLVMRDANKFDFELGQNVVDCSGTDMLDLLVLIGNCEGVIGCDSGLIWLGAATGKPALCFFSHVPARDRTMTCQSVWGIESQAECAACGDHVGTMPMCRFKDKVPACMQHCTPEFVRYTMKEFASL